MDAVPYAAAEVLPGGVPENPLVVGHVVIDLTVSAESTTSFAQEMRDLVARYAVATEVESSVNWQYEPVRDRIPGSEPSLGEIVLDRRLSTSIKEALREFGASPFHVSLFGGALERNRALTLRDVIVGGKGFVRRTKGGGPKMVAMFEGILATSVPEVEWKDSPTMEDVAAVCLSLQDVPAFAAGIKIYNGRTIQDVLNLPTIPDNLCPPDNDLWDYTLQGPHGEILESDHARVRQFAAQFQIAQARLRLRKAADDQR